MVKRRLRENVKQTVNVKITKLSIYQIIYHIIKLCLRMQRIAQTSRQLPKFILYSVNVVLWHYIAITVYGSTCVTFVTDEWQTVVMYKTQTKLHSVFGSVINPSHSLTLSHPSRLPYKILIPLYRNDTDKLNFSRDQVSCTADKIQFNGVETEAELAGKLNDTAGDESNQRTLRNEFGYYCPQHVINYNNLLLTPLHRCWIYFLKVILRRADLI